MSTWPQDAIDNLGRPLNRWDVCPSCGEPTTAHVWAPAGKGLVCRNEFTEKIEAQEFANRERAIEKRLREAVRKVEQAEREEGARKMSTRRIVTAAALRLKTEMRETRRQPDPINVQQQRKYFDE